LTQTVILLSLLSNSSAGRQKEVAPKPQILVSF
jgi:hypothetical protein